MIDNVELSRVEDIAVLLKKHDMTISTAESCTAGLVAFMLTGISGSSDYYKQGWVLYQEASKRNEFLLPHDVDVYSFECARLLAKTAMLRAGTSFGIGVTGLAENADKKEDAGVLWMSVCSYDSLSTEMSRKYFGKRNQVRSLMAFDILDVARSHISATIEIMKRKLIEGT